MPFSSLLARDLKLQRSQLLLPLGVRLVNVLDARQTEVLSGVTELDDRHRVLVTRGVRNLGAQEGALLAM